MEQTHLKKELIDALSRIYYTDAFSQLTDFLQGELKLLVFLYENKELDMSPSDLSSALYISRPRITKALSTLKRKGHIVTCASNSDRRRSFVHLTDAGEDFIRERMQIVDGYFGHYIQALGESESRELIRLIHLTVDIMDKDKKVSHE